MMMTRVTLLHLGFSTRFLDTVFDEACDTHMEPTSLMRVPVPFAPPTYLVAIDIEGVS